MDVALRSLLTGALSGALFVSAALAAEHPSCSLPDEVRERLVEIQTSPCRPDQPCWSEQAAELRDLRERHPGSVPVHRQYQDRAQRDDHAGVLAEYEALAAGEPAPGGLDRASALYLLLRLDRERLEELAGRAVELDPEHPWASFALMVTQLDDGAELDDELAARRYETFRAGCPREPWSALIYAGRFGEPEWWEGQLDEIEAAMTSESGVAGLTALPLLWQARFRLTPPAEHDALRERIREQVAGLDGASAPSYQHWQVVKQGAELVGDQEVLARAEAKLLELSPCSFDAVSAQVEAFWKPRGGHPMGRKITEEEARALFAQSASWLEECPESWRYRDARFAAARALPDLADAELLAEAEAALANWETAQKSVSMYQSPYFQVARLLLDRGLELERVPGLLDQEEALVVARQEEESLPAQMPPDLRSRIESGRIQQRLELELARVEAGVALTQLKSARSALDRADELVARFEDSADELWQKAARSQRAHFWVAEAELAAAAGRTAAARSVLRRIDDDAVDDEKIRTRLERLAARLELDLETAPAEAEEGVAQPSSWLEAEDPVGAFEVADLEGRTWTNVDLEGRTTLINFWATWCGPCVAELPLVEELHRSLAENEDLQVITVNIDQNPGLVQPFVTEHELSMPVLFGAELVQEWWSGAILIPRTWVIDREGLVRFRQMGFDATGKERWVAEARERMESAAGIGPASR
ncbi:MAG TPA: TlpA disulfide reductase family protein [Thermoanaerobaculia bacterium]|nr:TlpA disulfide reductase family protein [Thermoanaerobaculia bacterium]